MVSVLQTSWPLRGCQVHWFQVQTVSVSEAIPTTKWQYKTHWEDNKLLYYCNLAGTGAGPVPCPVVGPALGLWHVSSSQPALLPSAAWDAGCPGTGHSWARRKVKLPTPADSCNFLPWMIESPTPFPLQDQDPEMWSPFKSCFQGQVSSLHIPRRRKSIKTVFYFWDEKVMNISHSQIQKAASF